ncbi:hypothetical protein [Streptomyces sp. NPDC090994]|uniref:hypothetical protein n=1 Tax=Streptomyces sp. NPDC090994 TaxID=3365969 RepID=UPI0038087C3E
MPKVKFTAFATDAKTGERGYGTGETTIPNHIPRQNYTASVQRQLAHQGYKDADVHLTSVES